MNEQPRDAQTHHDDDTRPTPSVCPRAEDLVAYLYAEANETEAESFELHLSVCASCSDESAAFGGVRESIGAWRREALSVASAVAFEPTTTATSDAVHAFHTSATTATVKRSAFAAFREFFTLSPMWLRAASVAAMLAICALVVHTFARMEVRWDSNGVAFQMGVPERVVREVVKETVNVPVSDGVAQARVDELVAAHRRELEALRAQLQKQETDGGYVAVSAPDKRTTTRATLTERGTSTRRPTATRTKTAPRLPRDVAGNDEDLPRLYDLLSEVN
ncbi:MAG TPA: hypothetical protein VF666_05500 [Pyrinomonadaceae bacterium]|jgi:hypothetical protein